MVLMLTMILALLLSSHTHVVHASLVPHSSVDSLLVETYLSTLSLQCLRVNILTFSFIFVSIYLITVLPTCFKNSISQY